MSSAQIVIHMSDISSDLARQALDFDFVMYLMYRTSCCSPETTESLFFLIYVVKNVQFKHIAGALQMRSKPRI